jgi:hypothetical protein
MYISYSANLVQKKEKKEQNHSENVSVSGQYFGTTKSFIVQKDDLDDIGYYTEHISPRI